ncbi:MAG: hypothetical protein ABWX94_00350 [Candidatus Saccharimonadales bacterium]
MILLLHITIALISVAFTTYLFLRPSATKLYTSYGLMASTLVTGTYLIASTGGHLIEACAMGLIYTGAVSLGIVGARRKLATQKAR